MSALSGLRRPSLSVPTVLAAGRVALGVPAWVAPALSGRVYGFPRAHDPSVRYLVAVYGARACALGAATLLRPDDEHRRLWQALGLAVDIADTIAAARAPLPRRTRAVSLALTGGYAVAGMRALLPVRR